jgi:hypothetical protein
MFGNDPAPTPTPPAPVAPPPSPAYQANGGNARAPGTAIPKPYGGTLLTSPEGDTSASTAKKSLLGQ